MLMTKGASKPDPSSSWRWCNLGRVDPGVIFHSGSHVLFEAVVDFGIAWPTTSRDSSATLHVTVSLTYTPLIIRISRIPVYFQSICVDSEDEKFVSVSLLDSLYFMPRPMLIVLRFCLVCFPSQVPFIQFSISEPEFSARGLQEVPAAIARHARLITC
jgi:hypothetical protein